jgi:hypothetical protein
VLEHLRRSFSEGDANYEARFWYGRELFLNHRYDEAAAIALSVRQSDIPVNSLRKLRAPIIGADDKVARYEGIVTKKEATYLLLKCSDFQRLVLAHVTGSGSDVWEEIKVDTPITTEIAFSMEGPRALNIEMREWPEKQVPLPFSKPVKNDI